MVIVDESEDRIKKSRASDLIVLVELEIRHEIFSEDDCFATRCPGTEELIHI